MSLRVHELSKSYGTVAAVDRVGFELDEERALAILGPSGCGKSTLLRLVAGLEPPDAGRIELDDRDITALPAHRRPVGMVFQDFALFPHLDVAGNVAFALREAGWPAADRRRRVAELLELVGMRGSERRRPAELSGGQQQRVALARALAARPRLLLLDEPLSDLDPGLRGTLQAELSRIVAGAGVRSLYVTHDRDEALTVAPRLAIMRAGTLLQIGPGKDVLERPKSPWIARFLGYRNVFTRGGTVRPSGSSRGGSPPIAGRPEPAGSPAWTPESACTVAGPLARLDHSPAVLLRDDLIAPGGDLEAVVERVERSGQRIRLSLRVPAWGHGLEWQGYERELRGLPVAGDRLGLHVPEEAWQPLEVDDVTDDGTGPE